MVNLSEASTHVQPIYIPKASCPSIAKGGWPANFLCILKKKMPRVWLAGPREDGESMENRGMTDAKGKMGGGLYSPQIND